MTEAPIRFKVRPESRDVSRYVLGRLYRRRIVQSLLILSGLGILGAGWVTLRSEAAWTAALPALGMLAILPALLLGILPWLVRFHVRRGFQQGELGQEAEWLVEDEGVRIRSGERGTTIPWDEIDQVVETDTALALEWQQGVLLIPKSCIPVPEELDRIRSRFGKALGDRARLS